MKVSSDSLLFAYKFYRYLNNHVLGYFIGGSIAFYVLTVAENRSYARTVSCHHHKKPAVLLQNGRLKNSVVYQLQLNLAMSVLR